MQNMELVSPHGMKWGAAALLIAIAVALFAVWASYAHDAEAHNAENAAAPTGLADSIDSQPVNPQPVVSIMDATTVEGGAATFAVTLDRPSSQDVTVQWRTADAAGPNPATAVHDYAAVTTLQTLIINAGATDASVTVNTNQDSLDEADETFLAQLSNPANATLSTTDAVATGTITDDDAPPTVSVSLSLTPHVPLSVPPSSEAPADTLEGDDPNVTTDMFFTVTLGGGGSGKDVTVPYTLDGTATAGVDYNTPSPLSVTIPAGQLTGVISIPVRGDTTAEGTETVVVTLSDPTNAIRSTQTGAATATGSIFDDDSPTSIVVSVTPNVISEDQGGPGFPAEPEIAMTVTAALGDGSLAASDIPVTALIGATQGDTVIVGAAPTADLTARNDSEVAEQVLLAIPEGENSDHRTFTIVANDDSINEYPETMTIVGFAVDYTVFSPKVTITDNDGQPGDLPTVSVTAADVTEGDDPDTTTGMTFTATLSKASGKDVTVPYSLGGTATAGSDYNYPTPLWLTIAAGQRSGNIVVPVRGDTLDEDNETVVVALLNPVNAALSSPAVATGIINDNDALPTLSISDATAVDEGQTASFAISLSPESGRDVTFQWQTADDSGPGVHPATAGDDYTAVATAQTVTIAAGTTGVNVAVRTLPDAIDEHPETFLVRLSNPTHAILSTASAATGTINADAADAVPSVSVADSDGVVEGDDPNITTDMSFTVTLSEVSGKAVTVRYALGGTATAGSDYNPPNPLSITIPAGQQSGDILIPVRGDTIEEQIEFISVRLSAATNAVLPTPPIRADGFIFDDDGDAAGQSWVYVKYLGPSVSAEGDTVTFTFTARPPPTSDLIVSFYLGYNSASKDGSTLHRRVHEDDNWFLEESMLGLQEVTIPAGTSKATYTVATRSDYLDTSGIIFAAMLTPDLKKTDGPRGIGSLPYGHIIAPYLPDPADLSYLVVPHWSVATAQMMDGPDILGSTISILKHSYTGPYPVKSGTTGRFVLTTQTPVESDTHVKVKVKVKVEADGDILPEGAAGDRTFTIPKGERRAVIHIPTKPDTAAQPVTLRLTLLRGSYTRDRGFATAHTYFYDLDPLPTVTLTAPSEITGGQDLTVTLTANPAPAVDREVEVSISAPSGFVGVPRGAHKVIIPASGIAVWSIPTTDDSIDLWRGKQVNLALHLGSWYKVDWPSISRWIYIRDNDGPQAPLTPEVNITSASGGTEGQAVTFTVSANPAPTANLVVSTRVATSGDYGVGAGSWTVIIAADTTSATLTLPTTDDSTDEADGSVTLTLNPVSGYAYMVGPASSETVQVQDDDDPPPTPEVSITAAAGGTEGSNVTFTVSANPAPADDLAVSVTVATSGDYGVTAGPRTVTIAGGTSSATLTLPTTDDSTDEADGSVTLTLNGGSGYTVGPAASETVQVQDDDDAPQQPQQQPATYTADPQVIAAVEYLASQTHHGTAHVNRWQRALAALGALDPAGVSGGALTLDEARQMASAYSSPVWDQVVAELEAKEAFEAAQQTPPVLQPTPTPEVNITSAAGGTEGSNVTFTVSANPAPTADLAVSVTVTTVGDYGVTAGPRTVTITGGTASATLTLPTTDDSTDEADGSVTLTLNGGSGYTVGQFSSETVQVQDDDDAPPQQQQQPATYTVDPALIAEVQAHIDAFTARNHAAGVRDWNLILDRLEGRTGMSDAKIAAWLADSKRHGWQDGIVTLPKVQAALAALAAQQTQQTPPPPPTPEVSITSASGGTEGSNVTFTVSASPAPTADLAVSVTVTTSGDYGVTAGSRTVTIAGGGASKTLTLPTTDDSTDEADGSVTLTLNGGSGYTVGSLSSGVAQVQDDDEPQQQQQPVVIPVVSVTGGAGVSEGGSASFTVTANPTPASALPVSVTVTASGDYGATTGSRTVSVPTGGSATFTVATTNDGNDEADGSVTATANAGNGYTVSASQGAATVSVADDDDAPPVVIPVVSISGGSGVTEGGNASFTVTANPAPASALSVSVTVTASGDYGASTGSRTVTIPTGGSATFTVSTTNDGNDEADGSVTTTVNAGKGYTVSSSQGAATVGVSDDDVPVVSITGGNGVTEGGNASFTVTANPAPASALSVSVTVTASGDYGATTGSRTVTIPTGGSATFTVATTNDSADEADGSVTATVNAGNGYTVSSSQGAATVGVADDDVPVVSISGGNGVTEGGNASFTITASPVPAADLPVSVTVTASGDYGAATGSRTVTIPTDGTATFTVATTDDSVDEADGSVTATVNAGNGYTVSSSQGTATVSVADDDDAPPVETAITISIEDASASENDPDLFFEVTLSAASNEDVTVQWATHHSQSLDRARGGQGYSYDFWHATGEIRIRAGETSGTGAVWLNQDSRDEPDEVFTVTLSSPAGATLERDEATMTIIDDD